MNMAYAQTCPVCCGSGKIEPRYSGQTTVLYHGCCGAGWVLAELQIKACLGEARQIGQAIMIGGR